MDNGAARPSAPHDKGMRNPLVIRSQLPPSQRLAIDGRVRRGALHPVLPGAYCRHENPDWLDRAWAVLGLRPNAVLVGATAARLSYWPNFDSDLVTVAGTRFTQPPSWLRATQRQVPKQFIAEHGDLRLSTIPYTVLDLAAEIGGSAIDEALRRRATTIHQLNATFAALPERTGNTRIRRLLADSRDSPWSHLEREGHALLRRSRITGWRANHLVRLGPARYYLDAAFIDCRLALEFDGHAHHSGLAQFTADRVRQNQLVLAGWTVLRFTEQTLDSMPDLVRLALRQLRA